MVLLGLALNTDRYILSINLRNNVIDNKTAKDFVLRLKHNKCIFNVDLRNNINLNKRLIRKLMLICV